MKQLVYLLLMASFTCIYSCAVQKIENPHAKNTPGTVAINEHLLCDQTELTNFHWLEYEYWMKRSYGSSPEIRTLIQVDSSVWRELSCDTSFIEYYYRQPARRDFPVVGITQKQAEAFSKWRSDRVFEYILIKKGILDYNPGATGDDVFTIEKYFEGTYTVTVQEGDSTVIKAITPDYSIPYPEYRLPTAEERVLIFDYIDSTDYIFHTKKAKKYMKWRETNVPFLLAQSPCVDDTLVSLPTRPVNPFLDKKERFNLIYNSRGNVAEWGAEPNITYGGGWPHNVEYILTNDTISVNEANAWTGFRNVCEWKSWER